MKLNIKGKTIEVNEDKLIKLIKREGLEVKSGEFQLNQEYFYLTHEGHIFSDSWDNLILDTNRLVIDNAFPTKELAEQALERRKSIVKLWKWAKEKAPFEPDWSRETSKYYSAFDYDNNKLSCNQSWKTKCQTELPYFATSDELERFNTECREDLLKVFNVK